MNRLCLPPHQIRVKLLSRLVTQFEGMMKEDVLAFILEDICSGPDPALISTGRQGTLPLDLSVCLSVRLYTCLSLGLPVSIPVCLYVSLSVALSVCLSDSIPVCLSVPVCLYNCLCLPFRLSISLLSSNNFISLYTCTHTNTHTQTKS